MTHLLDLLWSCGSDPDRSAPESDEPAASTPTPAAPIEGGTAAPEIASRPAPARGADTMVYAYEPATTDCLICPDPKLEAEKRVSASTEAPGHEVMLAFDGDEVTGWCEGADGPGVGEWIAIDLDPPRDVTELQIAAANFASDEALAASPRVKRLEVKSDAGRVAAFEFADPVGGRSRARDARRLAPFLPLDWSNVKTLTVTIRDVYPGQDNEQACVTDLRLRANSLVPVP